jgi:hypothetical protein
MKGFHDSKTNVQYRDRYRTPPELVAYYANYV